MAKISLNSSLVKKAFSKLNENQRNKILPHFLIIVLFLTLLLMAVFPLFWLVLLMEGKEYHLD